jgi:hypothetical protein
MKRSNLDGYSIEYLGAFEHHIAILLEVVIDVIENTYNTSFLYIFLFHHGMKHIVKDSSLLGS